MVSHSYAQHHHHKKHHQKKFAEGYGDRETMGETIQSKGPSAMVSHSYAQNDKDSKAPASTPAAPGTPPKEKGYEPTGVVNNGATVIPGYIETMKKSTSLKGTMGDDGKYHIKDAQEQVDYLDERTTVANDRPPYKSTLGVSIEPGFIANAKASKGSAGTKGQDGKDAIVDA